jgi:tetratricopeptide (TPR) repeat protein
MIILKAKFWIPILFILLTVLIRLPQMYSEYMQNLALIDLEKVLVKEQDFELGTGKELDGILEKFEIAQQRQPDFGQNLRGYGIALWQAGELQRAARAFEAALETTPEDRIARLFLGDVVLELGNVEEARTIWAGTFECAILMHRIFSQTMSEDYDTVEYLLESPCDAALDSGYVAYNLPRTYSLLEKYVTQTGDQDRKEKICGRGSQVFEQLLLAHPSNAQTRIGFGQFLRECGHASEALLHFRMVEDSPQLGLRAWANVESGLAYKQMGNVVEALRHFEQAVQIDPENASNRILYGHALAETGRREQALAEYRIATGSSYLPWRSWAYGEMGLLYQDSGDWLLAIDLYEQAVNLDPTRDDYKVLLGKALAEMGNDDEARIQLMDALGSTNGAWRRWAQQELDQLDSDSSDK